MKTTHPTRCLLAAMLLSGAALGAAPAAEAAGAGPVHSVTDISHEFTFYFDGRFAKNYLTGRGDVDVRNWGTLHKFDFRDVNLLVLPSGASPCGYPPEDVAAVRKFLTEGGGVLVLGDFALFRQEKACHLNDLVRPFGAEFLDRPAKAPLSGAAELKGKPIKAYGGKAIRLEKDAGWQVLVADAGGQALAARRPVGKGKLLVASRALSGRQPDAKDPINAEWWQPLLRDLAAGKPVDSARRPRHQMPENTDDRGGLKVQYSDYMQPFAEEIFRIYTQCRPALEEILGVPPAEGMLTSLILLPTGGGGFSSGRAIGLGTWWGGFPQQRYGMVELLGHEATHSWVLPFGEPMWNEGLATYVGIQLGRKLGYADAADKTLAGWLRGARRYDPDFTKLDLAAGKDIPHAVRMAKPMWIWEQLRKETPDILARYFRLKRELADPKTLKRYTADDCVAVLSAAAGRDLFGWFRSLGISVDRSKATIKPPVGKPSAAAGERE
ncbi:MAG TPA: hypothetical protein VM695_05805 [Phycisphaerae bacterium]|nr:hypothetical protein [Phycisphaerae bacterium]